MRRAILKVDSAFENYTVYEIIRRLKKKVLLKIRFINSSARDVSQLKLPKRVYERFSVKPDISFPESGYDIVMCIPFTGRYAVLEFVLQEFFLAEKLNVSVGVCLVGSSDEDKEFAGLMHQKFKHLCYQHCENYPLGRKAQLALELSKKAVCSGVLMNGSDDVVDASYVQSCLQHINSGCVDYIAPAVWYTYCADASSAIYGTIWRNRYTGAAEGSSLGAGRVYSSGFLEKINYDVFAVNDDVHLDTKMEIFSQKGFVKSIFPAISGEGVVVSIKGDWGKLNEIDGLIDNCPTLVFESVEFETSLELDVVRRLRTKFNDFYKNRSL